MEKAPKNPAAQSLAKKRWSKTSKEERSRIARDMSAARWASNNTKGKKQKAKRGRRKKAV